MTDRINRFAPHLPVLLGALALLAFCVNAYLMFHAGCAGDLKSGAGDPRLALDLQGQGQLAVWLGIALGVIAIWRSTILGARERLHGALAFALFAYAFAWIAGVLLEARGVAACLQ